MIFVSDFPAFKVLSQVLELIYARVVIAGINDILMGCSQQPRPEHNTLEFYLSLMFYHLKGDASNLQLNLVDDLHPNKLLPLLQIQNNLTLKCFKLENFDFNYLFMRIKPQFFVEIFICIIHERKIVLVNNDIAMNAVIM